MWGLNSCEANCRLNTTAVRKTLPLNMVVLCFVYVKHFQFNKNIIRQDIYVVCK